MITTLGKRHNFPTELPPAKRGTREDAPLPQTSPDLPLIFFQTTQFLKSNADLGPEKEALLYQNCARIEELWPAIGENLPVREKARLLLSTLTNKLEAVPPSEETSSSTFAPETVDILVDGYLSQEQDKAVLLLYKKIRNKEALGATLPEKASAARTWIASKQEALNERKNLDLSGQKFSTIPTELSLFHNLEKLSFQKNEITSLPTNFDWPKKITFLSLSENQIRFIPQNMTWPPLLQRLFLNHNLLSGLPIYANWPASLQETRLGNNRFSEIPSGETRPPGMIDLSNRAPSGANHTPLSEERWKYTKPKDWVFGSQNLYT